MAGGHKAAKRKERHHPMTKINACDSCAYLTFDGNVCWCTNADSRLYGQEYPSTADCEVWEQYQPEE